MKKKIIICAVIISTIIALVPIPKNINQTFYGVETYTGENVNITIDMNYLRFLLLEDKMHGEITVTSKNELTVYGEHMSYQGLFPTNNDDKTMHFLAGFRYDIEKDTMLPVVIYLSRDFDKILISDRAVGITKQYIGHIAKNKTDEVLEYFVGYADR